MMSASDSPIWSFQKSVMIGIGNSVNCCVWRRTRRRGFAVTT